MQHPVKEIDSTLWGAAPYATW